MQTLSIIFILFIVYSILGWILEIMYNFYLKQNFINRGFLIGPYCPIYGVGCILVIFLLNKYSNNLLALFTTSIIICSVLEYSTSFIMEKIFNTRWWDYSDNKFNIKGRICADTMLPFGIISCFVVKTLNPYLLSKLENIPYIEIISLLVFIIFITDIIISTNLIFKFKKTMKLTLKDNTEEISNKVKEVFLSKGILSRRLINSVFVNKHK